MKRLGTWLLQKYLHAFLMPAEKKVIIALPVLLIGGTEMQTLSLVNVLVGAGYYVTVCCYYEYDESIVQRFKSSGAEVVLMKYARTAGLWHLAMGLMRLFKNVEPDIIHVQYLAPGLVPIMAARLAGFRTIFATVHIAGKIAYGLKARILLRLASSFCTAFFCVTKGVEEFWFGNSEVFDSGNLDRHRKHFTIYNAVDTVKIAQIVTGTNRDNLRATLDIRGKTVIGIVGRLAHQKGHAVLLDALAEVVSKLPEVVLLVIGEGPDRLSLERRAKSLNIDNNILWIGALPQDKVFEFYSIMDVLVMPSLYEGFGLTAAEAMAAGLPVVGTKVDGLTEVIENDITGSLVSIGDSAILSCALTGLLSDGEKAREMGQRGRKRVGELFSMEKFSRAILSVYRELA